MTQIPTTGLQLRSFVTSDGRLELSLQSVDVPTPRDGQVLVRVEAAPLNPSDLGLLFGGADMSTAVFAGAGDDSTVSVAVSEGVLRALGGRVGKSLAAGNEGAGTVVAAGASEPAQALLGRTVAVLGGSMYSQYRCVEVSQCLLLPERVSAVDGASCFVNPLTVLGHVGTMRREGHTALVHTAAASNLGQMLNRLCLADGISLVNIVRSAQQEALLRSAGAEFVCNSTSPSFTDDLTVALIATGATIAFDAIGGGRLAGEILTCMEAALVSTSPTQDSGYGTPTLKQVYIYGGLDRRPTELSRNFGMAWSVGGWLLAPYLQQVGAEEVERMRQRVAAEITTTFVSTYNRHISLVEALGADAIAVYAKQATGEKYLITPNA